MRFSFHPEAEAEYDQAVAFYAAKQSGLGLSLADEVLVAVIRILYSIVGHFLLPKYPLLNEKRQTNFFDNSPVCFADLQLDLSSQWTKNLIVLF
ncbi:hypothetical protein [Candidatus Nitrospira neomarina]|uniref:Type II toxin-antitoxin system RelE/ParE family toxin n=1 Tax=Candidatus Nitrospira neomarina TaxID=3020899 RepID=A0AA96GJX5_9BACT|nr:hypothetical protein [Candidatus Nitrospira neomarina]WNM62357.1 hypothetical protein PQG83_01025 [Candidatus Nitrospira neomarina]